MPCLINHLVWGPLCPESVQGGACVTLGMQGRNPKRTVANTTGHLGSSGSWGLRGLSLELPTLPPLCSLGNPGLAVAWVRGGQTGFPSSPLAGVLVVLRRRGFEVERRVFRQPLRPALLGVPYEVYAYEVRVPRECGSCLR